MGTQVVMVDGKTLQEFYCGECVGYISVNLRMDINAEGCGKIISVINVVKN